ncbi:ArsR family transcriptional regulator [Natrinema salsiterrestre]|uniref:Winged helix-turn-helix domain-containing protein n=1 Tax=Natrinema salsiterrestre TaxID=2950540 RepID=A0A9Q4L1Z1_9EURY|nr:ArsR family transcriptional regulator [Natrinema salsiterrestre]MDF9745047.1 winged helix-turn-helix domain-containing protein [Natrinema salsiterrestre]
MVSLTPFLAYDLAISLVVGVELLYFLHLDSSLTGYRRLLLITVCGLVLFVVGGPLAELLFPSFVHWVHGAAALLVIFGLYDPVRNDLRTEEWARLLLSEPAQIRRPAGWMTPMDDAILEVFHSSGLILTPAVVALNIDRSREEVNRRLSRLATHGLVEKVERGKYRLTRRGVRYLRGELHVALLPEDEP